MKKIHNRKELYSEIVKSFYQRKYVYGERFMTQVEAKDYYQVARPTVEKVYKMLQEDGLLISKRHLGSYVTFDPNNEEHLKKISLYHNNPDFPDFNTYDFPMITLSRGLYEGLLCANEAQLAELQKNTNEILLCIEMEKVIFFLIYDWHVKVISYIKNPFLLNILEHFLKRVIYFNHNRNITQEVYMQIRKKTRDFFKNVYMMLQNMDFSQFFTHYKVFYDAVYHVPEALLFSKVDINSQLFFEHSQYS